jgi:hypothetical protein
VFVCVVDEIAMALHGNKSERKSQKVCRRRMSFNQNSDDEENREEK